MTASATEPQTHHTYGADGQLQPVRQSVRKSVRKSVHLSLCSAVCLSVANVDHFVWGPKRDDDDDEDDRSIACSLCSLLLEKEKRNELRMKFYNKSEAKEIKVQ